MTFLLIILSSLAGGIVCVLLAGIILAVRSSRLDAALPRLISFSTGTLLGAALLGMIPHAAGFAAAGFLYVALADLVPAQRGKTSIGLTILDLGMTGTDRRSATPTPIAPIHPRAARRPVEDPRPGLLRVEPRRRRQRSTSGRGM